jgi:hypothetical protein
MAMKRTGFLMPMVSAVAVLILGLAAICFVPLPEERAYSALSQIQIKTFRVMQATPQDAVAALNAEIAKTGQTRYRIFYSADNMNAGLISVDLSDMPADECAYYISELSGLSRTFNTPDGIMIDHSHHGHRYFRNTWRSKFRYWVRYDLPAYWSRWRRPPPGPDPFAPAGGP